MKCEKCGKDIPEKEQLYVDVGDGKIPLPCEECIAEIKKRDAAYPPFQKRKP
jgi:hypothetical protein